MLGIVVCLGLAGGYYWLKPYWVTPPKPSAAAVWVSPQVRTIANDVTATGTVKLRNGAEVRVGAQLSGIVEKLHVGVGSRVKKGDVIAEIDSRAVEAKVAQAQAQLAHDEIALEKAKRDDARIRQLAIAQYASAQQADDSKANLELAQATVDASQRALDSARVELNYIAIRAPISGTVASVSTQQGETIAATFAAPTFVTIIADNAMEVVALVDEADIGGVRAGQAVDFTTETYPDLDFAGQVVRIAPTATIVSGVVNYEVGIAITGDMSALKPDMTTNVTIHTSSRRALFLPLSAIRTDPSGTFVLVKTLDGSRRAPVAVGPRRDGMAEIISGISPSETVLAGKTS
jgi:macrolide-specific efflux system membrane fusion protein